MIDLHTHTLWSDGELVPAEHIRRASMAGYEAIAITDHADSSNIEVLCRESVLFSRKMRKMNPGIIVLSGLELTHILPEEIKEMTQFARGQGVDLVLVHGETITEPVRPGTNRAAIEAGVDILAHPGFITLEEAELAVKQGVYLEITARKGHSLTNGHVAAMALKSGAQMVIDSDTHSCGDYISREFAQKVLGGCGLSPVQSEQIFSNSRSIVKKIVGV